MIPTWLWITAVNVVIVGLITYVWRSLEKRVSEMESESKSAIANLLAHPVLTISGHEVICEKITEGIKANMALNTEILCQRIEEGEKRTALLIENAILTAVSNGKAKTSMRSPKKRKK